MLHRAFYFFFFQGTALGFFCRAVVLPAYNLLYLPFWFNVPLIMHPCIYCSLHYCSTVTPWSLVILSVVPGRAPKPKQQQQCYYRPSHKPHQTQSSSMEGDNLSSQCWQGMLHLGKQEQLYILSTSVIRPRTLPGQFGQSALPRDLSQETVKHH